MSSSDSGPEDRNAPKKQKREKPSSDSEEKDTAPKRKKKEAAGDDGEVGGKIPLGSKRFVSISEFRGKKLVDIREWYGGDDDLKPGKKGISLSKEQFEKLSKCIPEIMKKLQED